MTDRMDDQLKQLKKDYFELERTHYDEKESLFKVINTFGAVVASNEDMAEEVHALKKSLDPDQALPLDFIENELSKLKDKIIGRENDTPNNKRDKKADELEARLQEAVRIIRKTMVLLLEDFYPLSSELESKASTINIKYEKDITRVDLETPTNDFSNFIKKLRAKISKDFKYINGAFLTLLEHVKGLEKVLTNEFGEKERLKKIEYFEMKVNSEVGSIVDSFNVYTTISEVKNVVIGKIENIKRLVSLKKKEESKKAQIAQKSIEELNRRIIMAEKAAREMSSRAEKLQTAAMNDGLTGLYNRKAFDTKINQAIGLYNQTGERFSLVLFDVDKFKEINDTFGHIAGDKVLKKVAQCLKETFREDDFIARYGGDEFVVVIQRLTKKMADEKVLDFRKNLKKRRFISHSKGDINLTVSAGIAMVEKGDTSESLIEKSDKSMYEMKQQDKS